MKLKDWLLKNKIKSYHLSKVLDISPVTIHRHLVKERPLRGNIAIRVERYTKGKVTLKEMIADKREKNSWKGYSNEDGDHNHVKAHGHI